MWWRLTLFLLVCCCPSVVVAQCQDVWVQVGDAFGDDACQVGEVPGDSTTLGVRPLLDETASIAVYACDSGIARATVYDRSSSDSWVFRPDTSGSLSNLGQPQDLSADGTILAFDRGVYQYDGTMWNQLGNDITTRVSQGALAGDGLTVAYRTLVDVSVYTYNSNTAQWEQQGDVLSSSATELGGISGDGTTVAVIDEGDESVVDVFRFSNGAWQQIGESIEVDGRIFLTADLSQDGNTIVIGDPRDRGPSTNSDLGAVNVYRFQNGQWAQVGDSIEGGGVVDCEGLSDVFFFIEPTCNDESGYSVAISSAGDRVAIGSAPMMGYVRVFEDVGGEWRQVGGDLFPSIASQQVSISSDGTTIAIGGSDAPVQVFEIQCVAGAVPRPTQAPFSPEGECSLGFLCPVVAFFGNSVFLAVFGPLAAFLAFVLGVFRV